MRAGERWPDETEPEPIDAASAFVAILKGRLSAAEAVGDEGFEPLRSSERPWDANDERRYRKLFERPSPLSHQLSHTF